MANNNDPSQPEGQWQQYYIPPKPGPQHAESSAQPETTLSELLGKDFRPAQPNPSDGEAMPVDGWQAPNPYSAPAPAPAPATPGAPEVSAPNFPTPPIPPLAPTMAPVPMAQQPALLLPEPTWEQHAAPLAPPPEQGWQPVLPDQGWVPPAAPSWQPVIPDQGWQPVVPDQGWQPIVPDQGWQPILPSAPAVPASLESAVVPTVPAESETATAPDMPAAPTAPVDFNWMPQAAPAAAVWTPPSLLPEQVPLAIQEEIENSLDDETVADEAPIAAIPAIILDDGEEIEISGPLILGRNPRPYPDYLQARLQPIADDSKRMSKTHMLIYPQDGELYVRDLGSRNGVRIEIDGESERIAVGQDVLLAVNASVQLGGRYFTVRVPAAAV